MEEAYRRWTENFTAAYNRTSGEWSDACLAGLKDKERWIAQANAAASSASTEAMMAAVGAEAERMARVMDTRDPLNLLDANAAQEADRLLTELLGSPGIVNASSAFKAINGIAELSPQAVKRSVSKSGSWDAAIVKSAASNLARETNAELAAREARRLAFQARTAADEAVKALAVQVDNANTNFRESMDNMFVFQGLWRKSGRQYIKDIIYGSSLFEPVISEEKRVERFTDYKMEAVNLKTNIDPDYLSSLDAFAVMGLIENVYREVEEITAGIFGGKDEKSQVIKKEIDNPLYSSSTILSSIMKPFSNGEKTIKLKDRELSPGKFGQHLGYEPATKPQEQFGDTRASIFYDRGSGEIGRLMTEFIYWSVIDGKGSAEIFLAPWEKRMWDDRDSFFKAPNLRSVVSLASQIVLAAVPGMGLLGTIAIGSASDLLFGALDVAGGYKTLDEAGFEFGKSLLTSSVNTLGGAGLDKVFKAGAGIFTGTAGKIAYSTVTAGAKSATLGIANSAINGITYTHDGKWGYSYETFEAGLKGAMVNSIVSMGSTFTTKTLTAVNSGLDMEKLTGFSVLNKGNVERLNNLAGSLAGEGIRYGMGGDFTLNVLNTGLFSEGKVNTGLLELHLGRNGASMNIGSGGANISPDNIYGVVQG
jgi:hypothetical protein